MKGYTTFKFPYILVEDSKGKCRPIYKEYTKKEPRFRFDSPPVCCPFTSARREIQCPAPVPKFTEGMQRWIAERATRPKFSDICTDDYQWDRGNIYSGDRPYTLHHSKEVIRYKNALYGKDCAFAVDGTINPEDGTARSKHGWKAGRDGCGILPSGFAPAAKEKGIGKGYKGVAGYCEVCFAKFTCYEEHVARPEHRSYAEDDYNYRAIDLLMKEMLEEELCDACDYTKSPCTRLEEKYADCNQIYFEDGDGMDNLIRISRGSLDNDDVPVEFDFILNKINKKDAPLGK